MITIPPKCRRPVLALLAAVLLPALALLGVVAPPASAHSGGKAVVLVKNLTVAPMGSDWHATATLVDFDSGNPVAGGAVTVLAGQAAKPVQLKAGAAPGIYEGMISGVSAGTVSLGLKVRSLPGAEAIAPFDQTYQATLTAEQPTTVVSNTAGGGNDGGGNDGGGNDGGGNDGGGNGMVGILAAGGGAVLVAGLLYGLFAMRRRTAVPARAR